MSKIGRNDPCWCGSEKKYKKCHLNREQQERPSIWEVEKSLRKAFSKKTCLHPSAGPTTCEGKIVRAHTVRRSADLKAIARNGHVYAGSVAFSSLDRHHGRIAATLVGINDASTFWGFCQAHDTSTFAPLETKAFVPTDDQVFLLAYRPLVKELYLKLRQRETIPLGREADKGQSMLAQLSTQRFIADMTEGIEAAVGDMEWHKREYDRDLMVGDYSTIRYVVLHLDRPPDVMCSGATQPMHDFDGKQLQDLADTDTPAQLITFSLIATGSSGAAVFAWREDSDVVSGALVDSLLKIDTPDVPHALLRYAYGNFENTFAAPAWWDALDQPTRRSLEARITHSADPFTQTPATVLADDGVRAVQWQITRIEQKRS